jgi:glyoxylate/hydroxypyruvate reductase A
MATADELRAAIEAHGVPLATPEELDAMGPDAWRRVRMAAVWKQPRGLLERCGRNLRVAMSLGAGVDFLLGSTAVLSPDGSTVIVPETPSLLPAGGGGEEEEAPLLVARIVDPHMASRMASWVAWGVLTWQRRMLEYAEYQRRSEWAGTRVEQGHNVDSRCVQVALLGYGIMGRSAAALLARMGYCVNAWARGDPREKRRGRRAEEAPKEEERGLEALEEWDEEERDCGAPPGRIRVCWPTRGPNAAAEQQQLRAFVAGMDVLVVLLPLTPQTVRVVDADLLARLEQGACLINGARGAHVDAAAALAALDQGQLDMALLDVFDEEPLPSTSPLWKHPRVVITPHSAAFTEVGRAAEQVGRAWRAVVAAEEEAAEGQDKTRDVRQIEAEYLAKALGANLVDREAGY